MGRDKEWEARMQGMIYAYNLVKQGGMEALEQDMKRRNFLRAPMKFTAKQMEEIYNGMAAKVYNNMLTGMLYAIHDTFGFGKIRPRPGFCQPDGEISPLPAHVRQGSQHPLRRQALQPGRRSPAEGTYRKSEITKCRCRSGIFSCLHSQIPKNMIE
jgi:hypothetical protein